MTRKSSDLENCRRHSLFDAEDSLTQALRMGLPMLNIDGWLDSDLSETFRSEVKEALTIVFQQGFDAPHPLPDVNTRSPGDIREGDAFYKAYESYGALHVDTYKVIASSPVALILRKDDPNQQELIDNHNCIVVHPTHLSNHALHASKESALREVREELQKRLLALDNNRMNERSKLERLLNQIKII